MLLKAITIIILLCQAEALNWSHCETLLRELGDKQKYFIYCVTTNSAPVTMCTICEEYYTAVQDAYDLIATDTNCTAMYFDKDRINMLASTDAVLMGLWSKAYCADCKKDNNSDVFNEKNLALKDCLDDHKKDACEECKMQYTNLNNFYIHLDQHNNGEVCYDLQDSMNRTRNNWSKKLKCCRREYNINLFAIALCIISCLPFLFYGGTYLLTKRQERNHEVLTDEDPLLYASIPSTSNINNPSTSRNNSSSNTTKVNKKVFNLLDNDAESSDEEINVPKHYKKI